MDTRATLDDDGLFSNLDPCLPVVRAPASWALANNAQGLGSWLHVRLENVALFFDGDVVEQRLFHFQPPQVEHLQALLPLHAHFFLLSPFSEGDEIVFLPYLLRRALRPLRGLPEAYPCPVLA